MPVSLTLANPKIKNYLEGKSTMAPVGELIYVHQHPKVENFLSEVEVIINYAALHLQSNPQKAGIAQKIARAGQEFATKCNDIREETALGILESLRTLYQLCVGLAEIEKKRRSE